MLGSPPVIVEFQHTVNEDFLRRVTNYCLEATKRCKMKPIVLIVCINTLSADIQQCFLPASRVSCCYAFPCQVWATECFILSESSLKKVNTIPPLNPLIALGLFLTNQATSIINSPYAADNTIKKLHTLALEHYQTLAGDQYHLIDVLNQTYINQEEEYVELLELCNNHAWEMVIQTIQQGRVRNQESKRRYIDIEDDDDHIVAFSSSISAQRGMEFVEKFKKARTDKGFKKMDWVTCLAEGKKKNLFDYRTTETLRSQFNKFHIPWCVVVFFFLIDVRLIQDVVYNHSV